VPFDTGPGVFAPVSDRDVEPRVALLPRARRADYLHCSGGHLFLDWAPLPGNTIAGRSYAAERYASAGGRRAILLRRTLYDWDSSVHQWDRCPTASLRSSDDSSGVWDPSAPPD
jgi:hypothetical protein